MAGVRGAGQRVRPVIAPASRRSQGGGSAARVSLVPYLRRLGLRELDLLVVSHADSDHAGGVDDLLLRLPAMAESSDGTQAVRSPPAGK